jgi:hypothetical protein
MLNLKPATPAPSRARQRLADMRLTDYDAAEAAKLAAWARSEGSAPPPAADSAERMRLERELTAARARSDAARRAVDGMTHEVNAANQRVASISRDVPLAVGAVILEELAPLCEEARAAAAKIHELRAKCRSLMNAVLGLGERDAEHPGRPALSLAHEQAFKGVTDAFCAPLDDGDAAADFRLQVAALSAALHSDASATLTQRARANARRYRSAGLGTTKAPARRQTI